MGLDWVQSVTVVSVLGSIRETLGVVQLIAGTLDKLLVLVGFGTLFSTVVMGGFVTWLVLILPGQSIYSQ